MSLKRNSTFSAPPAKRMRKDGRPIPVIDLTADTDTHNRSFRFLDLPAEIRRRIYHYVIPHDLSIRFVKKPPPATSSSYWTSVRATTPPGSPGWTTLTFGKEQDVYSIPDTRLRDRGVLTSLFYVNKFVSTEARAILYGENTFVFRVDALPHRVKSLSSPRIFGAFGYPEYIHLLRNLRRINLVIAVSRPDYWTCKRHRGRLDNFVNIMKQHADDENQKSLLRSLKVSFTSPPSARCMYSLESLAALQGIMKVEVEGDSLPDWYKTCLALVLKGQGGDVLPLDYPEVLVNIKIKERRRNVYKTTKLWHQPSLNWHEFAERNGVITPAAADIIDLTQD